MTQSIIALLTTAATLAAPGQLLARSRLGSQGSAFRENARED
jgi:hypothetical protein